MRYLLVIMLLVGVVRADNFEQDQLLAIQATDLNRMIEWIDSFGDQLYNNGTAIYYVHTTLINRAGLENALCEYDERNGRTCRFGSVKELDHYIKKFDSYIGNTLDKNLIQKSARKSLCSSGYYVGSFSDGVKLCSSYGDMRTGEQHRFACAQDVWAHTVILNRLIGSDVYKWWEDYTIGGGNRVWDDAPYEAKYTTFVDAALNHWACSEHLKALKHAINVYGGR